MSNKFTSQIIWKTNLKCQQRKIAKEAFLKQRKTKKSSISM